MQLSHGICPSGKEEIPMVHIFFFFPFVCLLFRVVPEAYGGSQTRGQIRAVAAGLRHSHSNARSEPRVQPTPQLTAMPDRRSSE